MAVNYAVLLDRPIVSLQEAYRARLVGVVLRFSIVSALMVRKVVSCWRIKTYKTSLFISSSFNSSRSAAGV